MAAFARRDEGKRGRSSLRGDLSTAAWAPSRETPQGGNVAFSTNASSSAYQDIRWNSAWSG